MHTLCNKFGTCKFSIQNKIYEIAVKGSFCTPAQSAFTEKSPFILFCNYFCSLLIICHFTYSPSQIWGLKDTHVEFYSLKFPNCFYISHRNFNWFSCFSDVLLWDLHHPRDMANIFIKIIFHIPMFHHA